LAASPFRNPLHRSKRELLAMVGNNKDRSRAPEGSYGEITRVAWPIVVSMLSYTAMSLADTVFVAQIGTTEVAAVGLATTATFTLTCFAAGLLNAVKVVASQAWGAGNGDRSREVGYQGLGVAVLLGIIVLGLAPLAAIILSLMGAEGAVHTMGVDYFRIRIFGAIPIFASLAAFGYFQGLGDTKTPMRVQVGANIINIVLDYLLIFGVGPFPEMGTSGAAVATVIAFGVQGLVGTALFLRATWHGPKLRLEGTRELLRLGLPIGVRYLLDVLSWAVFTAFVARQGEAHLAAHIIAIRIVSVSFLPGHGIGEAACVLTGQAVGAGDMAAAHRVARRSTVIGLWVMGLCGLGFLLFGATIVGLFNPAADVLEVGASLLVIAAAFQLFDAVAMIKTGALNGAGDTTYVMLVSVITSWTILVPLGWALCVATGQGAPGAWLAITAQVVVMAGLYWRRWDARWRTSRPVAKLVGQSSA